MAYTRPSASAADAIWQGASAYTRSSASAADATFVSSSSIDCTIAAAVSITASLSLVFATEIDTSIAAVLPIVGSINVAHGIAGAVVAAVGIAGAVSLTHERYEVKGVAQIGSVLADRRVRVYRRATGDLVVQGDTVAGAFRLTTGFDAGGGEVYVLPIDLSGSATDWVPPVANRVVPTLAMDT